MRERSTWNREDVMTKAAALDKKADPYTMNQEHPQPAWDKYVTGDPSTFAEDVHTPNTWEAEYANGTTKRDEIGLPEMRSDTFNHSEKTANDVLWKKADLCVAVAQMMLAGKKAASDKVVEDQAVALMHLSDEALLETHSRLAAQQQDDEGDEDEGQEKQAQQQQQQQQQSDDDDADEDEGGEQQSQQQQKQAEQSDDESKDDEDEGQEKQAQQEQQQESDEDEGQDKEAGQNDKANKNWPTGKTAEDMQQMAQQIQQMAQQVQQMMQAQQQQQMPPQQADMQMEEPQMSDDMTLDQMLAASDNGPMAEADIQMDAAPMDVGMGDLGPEDAILRKLFAQDDDESQDEDEGQQKQAHQTRTASTRTVGTRPTGGVSTLGGGAAAGSGGGSSVDNLSSLWQSAPDVRDAFGLK